MLFKTPQFCRDGIIEGLDIDKAAFILSRISLSRAVKPLANISRLGSVAMAGEVAKQYEHSKL